MKERLKKIGAALIAVYIIISGVPALPVSAATAQPTTYSKESNSGTRGVVCTTLNGTSASSYYTGSYTYENLSGQSASTLKSNLHTLMTSTHKYTSSYDDCRDEADRTDCENNNGRVVLIYTSYSATMSQYNGWNREHVWPKSKGGNNTSGGGADLHHIRPSDAGVNSSRGNKPYGYAGSGASEKHGSNPANGVLGGTYNSTYFEPLDNVKGDVARIVLYVYVRWGSAWGADNVTEVFQSVDVLLEWCALDPVDTWEMGRNEVVQKIQGNRNVFIDYPEYAWQLYGKTAPSNMTTPSGKASNGNVGGGNSGNTEETTTGNSGGNNEETTTGNSGGNNEETTTSPGGSSTPVEPTATPIATIKNATSGSYTAEGVVIAKNARSYLVRDNTGTMMVYVNSAPSVNVGDKVRVEGNVTQYGGMTQFDKTATTTKIGTAAVNTPVPKILDGAACDAYNNKISIDYVKVVGKLNIDGNYYNLAIDGATITGSISYPADTATLASYNGKDVEVMGYITGITGSTSKYLQIMMTGIKEYDPDAVCTHKNTTVDGKVDATCTDAGYTGDTYCADCGTKLSDGEEIPAAGEHSWGEWTKVNNSDAEVRECSACGETESRNCNHTNTTLKNVVEPDCVPGYTGDTYCADCGTKLSDGEEVSPVGPHDYGEWTLVEGTSTQTRTCSRCGGTEERACPHETTELKNVKADGCGGGYTGDTYCTVCNTKTKSGTTTSPKGDHTYGDWVAVEGTNKERHECTVCGHAQERTAPCYHKTTEVRNAKVATDTTDGYTGDTYCTDCGKLVSSGEIIKATGSQEGTSEEESTSAGEGAVGGNSYISMGGCESSVSGGAVIIVCAMCAIGLFKKKKEH